MVIYISYSLLCPGKSAFNNKHLKLIMSDERSSFSRFYMGIGVGGYIKEFFLPIRMYLRKIRNIILVTYFFFIS